MRVLQVGLLVILCAVTACSHDGRTLAQPTRPAPTTTIAAVGTGGSIAAPQIGSAAAAPLVLTSSKFLPGSEIPAELTCDGTGASPPLAWTGVAPETAQLALSVIDIDAGAFVHWVMTGLPTALRSIGEGIAPEGAIEGANSAGGIGWTGPCPPAGTLHHYVFTLYELAAGCGTQPDVDQLAACATATATLTSTYTRR
jgi:Raf kinase inhibitor-like YbhB/YbcL family protein